jgi:hypothetical protein
MKGFEGILAIDAGQQLAILFCSGTITDFICSPFDTPKGPDGVIFSIRMPTEPAIKRAVAFIRGSPFYSL